MLINMKKKENYTPFWEPPPTVFPDCIIIPCDPSEKILNKVS